MRTPRHSGLRRRRAVPSILMLAVAVAFVASGSASGESGDASSRFQAASLTPDSTFTGAKSQTGYLARTDPALLGANGRDADQHLRQVRLRRDRVLHRRRRRPQGHQPERDRQGSREPHRGRARLRRATRPTLTRDITADVKAAVPSLTVRATFRTVYGGIAASVPANEIERHPEGRTASPRSSRTRSSSRSPTRRRSSSARPQVWPSVGGSVKAGKGVIVGVLDTGIWPEHPSFRDTGLARRRRFRTSASSATARDPLLGPAFTCNNKLVGAYAFTNTYMAVFGAEPGEYCNNVTGAVLGARLRTGTARTRPRRPPATRSRARRSSGSSAARSAASRRART